MNHFWTLNEQIGENTISRAVSDKKPVLEDDDDVQLVDTVRTLLATAVLNLYIVKDGYLGKLTRAQKTGLESVARSLEELKDMLRNCLDLSRLERGEIKIAKTYFPLNARVIQPVLEELLGEEPKWQMAIENDIPDTKVVWADASLLKIVYRNLLSNAIKYGRDGGTIRLDLYDDGPAVKLRVYNDGIGIPPDQISSLFKKFGHLYSPEHPTQRGTGLGLYICREIVERHGGAICARSHAGEWARFSFTLPLEEVSNV